MKKRTIGVLAILIVLLSLSSCCQVCSYGGYKEQICRDQFTSDADYNNEIWAYEAGGWDCK